MLFGVFGLRTFYHKTDRHIWIIGHGILLGRLPLAASVTVLNDCEAGRGVWAHDDTSGHQLDSAVPVFRGAQSLRVASATGEKQLLLVIVLCDSSSIAGGGDGGGGIVGCGTRSTVVE